MRRNVAAALLACAAFTGCALTPETIAVEYAPSTNVLPIAVASSVPITVVVSDARGATDRVASKQNMYGMEMAAISTTEEIPEIVKSAMEAELSARGYAVNDTGVVVACEVFDFSSKFQSGFWSGTAVANVRLNVKVRNAQGSYIFSELVRGEGRKEKIQLASGANAKPALDAALKQTMDNLFARPDFFAAIARAAEGSAP